MGLMQMKEIGAALAMIAIAVSLNACSKSDGGGGSTVAAVPANTCVQPGGYFNGYGGPQANGYNNGYPQPINGANGYGNPATLPPTFYQYNGLSPYNYNGSGCAAGSVPACYPGTAGVTCVPQTTVNGIYNQGYLPGYYQYQPQGNSYAFQGYGAGYNTPYTTGNPSWYTPGYGGTYGGVGMSAYFNFQYNLGPGGYAPNGYIMGCSVNSMMSGCGFGGICQPLTPGGSLGICVR